MGQIFLDQQSTWAGGLYTSAEPDRIPPNSYPVALNNALFSLADGNAIPGKRPGMGQIHNTTPFTGSPSITGQAEFTKVEAGSLTKQHVCTLSSGSIAVVDTNGSFVEIAGWTPTYSYPDFESANNRLFMVDGTTAKKWTGSVFQNFGIARPVDTDWGNPTDVVTGGNMPFNSEYEIALTYYNSTSGHESSRSEGKFVVTADDASNTHTITIVGIVTPADTQIDKIRVYIRKTGLSTIFTQVVEINSNAGGVGINVTDEQINNQIIAAPTTDSNDPPPQGSRYLALHEGRMFVSDGSDIYYSQINKPEAFTGDAIAGVSRDGQPVTGLHATGGQLLILKQDSIWGVFGSDPQTWTIRLLVPDIGCVSHRSIVEVEGLVFWWSEQGPVAWGGGAPDPIGKRFLAPTFHPSQINSTSYPLICAGADVTDQKILFAYPSASSNRADLIASFNYRVGSWEGINDPMDVASFGVASDGSSRPWVFLGNHNGQLNKCGRGSLDGLPVGSGHTGTFVATSTTHTGFTLSGLSDPLPTTNGSLLERKVTVVDSLGRPVSVYRARITANTSSALTITPAVGQLTIGATYTVYIASPDWQLDTRWFDANAPFFKKRYEWLYLALRVSDLNTAARIDIYDDFSTTRDFTRTLYGNGTPITVTWDSSTWDSASWSALGAVPARRIRMGLAGQAIKARFRNHIPNETIALLHFGLRGEFLRDKR